MHFQSDKYITATEAFYVTGAIYLLVLPLKFLAAWCVAAFVHELSHVAALLCFNKRIYRIRIGANGAIIETEPLTDVQEIICSLAGPAGALLTLVFCRFIPHIAVCAFAQSVFNLLPFYPLDGGRALRSIWSMLTHHISCVKYPCKDTQQIVQ